MASKEHDMPDLFGFFASTEHERDYLSEYGPTIEKNERAEQRQIEAKLSAWLSICAAQLRLAYEVLPAIAEELAPGDPGIGKLARQAVLAELVSAINRVDGWNQRISCGGTIIPRTSYAPYQALLATVLDSVDRMPSSRDSIFQAAASHRLLYPAETRLSRTSCGEFWTRLIAALPALDPSGEDPDTVGSRLDTLFSTLAECRCLLTDEDPYDLSEERQTYFTHHRREALANAILRLDRDTAEKALLDWDFEAGCPPRDLLIVAFPAFIRGRPIDELLDWTEGDILETTAQSDPDLAVQMFRLLLDAADPRLCERDMAERLLVEDFSRLYAVEKARHALIRALRGSDYFAAQLYLGAAVCDEHVYLIDDCLHEEELDLRQNLINYLDSNAYSDSIWIEPALLPQEEDVTQEDEPAGRRSPRRPFKPRDPLPDDGRLFRYCTVTFGGDGRTYAYLTGDLPLLAGDWVEVPVGRRGEPKAAQVQSLTTCSRSEAPWPPEQTKTVLRRLDPPGSPAKI